MQINSLVDILVISFFIYVVLVLVRQSRSFVILTGLALLGILYAFAQTFNLYLTTIALQALFSALVIILVVLFQSELRKFFEYLALIGNPIFKRKKTPPIVIVSSLVNAVTRLSASKTGALIIISGETNIANLVSGGTDLEGLVSDRLLENIFFKKSPGHDGAVIISLERIIKFASHLPLSMNFKELGGHGTRHSAGLGISERSDCLSIIVSEESGRITIAQNGKLKEIEVDQLQSILEKRYKNKDTHARILINQLFLKNTSLKIVSVVLASILWWLSISYNQESQKQVVIPIKIEKLPENLRVQDVGPKYLTVTLKSRGSKNLSAINSTSVEATIDAKDIKNGLNTISFNESLLKHPLGSQIVSIDPPQAYIIANSFKIYKLPIKVPTIGKTSRLIKVTSIVATPSEIEVWIPESEDAPSDIKVPPIDLSTISESEIISSTIILPKKVQLNKVEDEKITIAITLEKK